MRRWRRRYWTIASLQIRLCDGERHPVRLRIVAVGQHDHAQVRFRITHDHIAKTDGLAGMPQRGACDAPAETVLDLVIVGFRPWRERKLSRSVAEQAVVVLRGVP